MPYPHKNPIYTGKECPYCGRASEFIESREVHKNDHGKIYICRPCDAWVGVYRRTDRALGRLANADLRRWRESAYFNYNHMWQKKLNAAIKKNPKIKRAPFYAQTMKDCKKLAFAWIKEQLKLPEEFTHIGMFDIGQCRRVAQICKPYIKTTIK